MNRMNLRKKAMLLLALILVMTMGSGCSRSDWADLLEIGIAWAQANNVLDAEGKPVWSSVVNVASGTSLQKPEKDPNADPGIEALIDAGEVVENFNKAEALSKEARIKHDIKLLDQAIDLRKNDYSYRNQKGSMLFFEGDGSAAEKEYDTADDLSASVSSAAYIRNLQTRAKHLAEEKDQFRKLDLVSANKITKEQEDATIDRYFKRMAAIYKELYDITGNADYKSSYEAFANR